MLLYPKIWWIRYNLYFRIDYSAFRYYLEIAKLQFLGIQFQLRKWHNTVLLLVFNNNMTLKVHNHQILSINFNYCWISTIKHIYLNNRYLYLVLPKVTYYLYFFKLILIFCFWAPNVFLSHTMPIVWNILAEERKKNYFCNFFD